MSILSALKKAVTDISRDYSRDDTFLNAVCASAALVANADGVIEQSERDQAVKLVRNHQTLSTLYNAEQVERAVSHCLDQSKTTTGKMELARYLDAVLTKDNGIQMAMDVYAVAMDIAAADGSVGEQEKAVMAKIASRLKVDVSKFDF